MVFGKDNKVIGISYRQLFSIQHEVNNFNGNWQVSVLLKAVMVLILDQMVKGHPSSWKTKPSVSL